MDDPGHVHGTRRAHRCKGRKSGIGRQYGERCVDHTERWINRRRWNASIATLGIVATFGQVFRTWAFEID